MVCEIEKETYKSVKDHLKPKFCCGKEMIKIFPTKVNVIGTRDNFGIGKGFYDENTGKFIDNWKDWEKAGYKDAVSFHKNSRVKAGIKRKKEKIEKYDSGKRKSIMMGV